MKMNRRNVLVGLGGIVASGGALLGTGAFSQVEASRDVTIGVAEDNTALIGLSPGSSEHVFTNGDGQLEIDLSESELGAGVNVDAKLTIENAFSVVNNHSGEVEIDITDSNTEVDFEFTPSPTYTLGNGNSQDDIDLSVVTNNDTGEFAASLTITATPTGN